MRSAICFLALSAVALAHEGDGPLLRRLVAALPAAPLGAGAWRFEIEPSWAKLPPNTPLGPTHGGVAIDRAGLIYVSTDGPSGVLVFAPDGKLVRTIAPEFSGIHGLMIREEGGKEFIYAAHLKGNQVVKLGLDGSLIWKIGCPTESGFYPLLADFKPKTPSAKPGPTVVGHDGRTYLVEGFKPTAIAVGPDNRIYVADGYGASVIHLFSADRKYLRTIGTKGAGDGQFATCHGLALDTRSGKPLLLVCDRQNRRLVHLDLEGNFVRTLTTGLRLPCSVSIMGDYAAVAELEGRVVVTDQDGKVVATLGDNPDKEQWAKYKLAPELWREGIFVAPHGVAFDAAGNLFVQDWNYIGRLTKLRRAPQTLAALP